jgi:hypothetical protein
MSPVNPGMSPFSFSSWTCEPDANQSDMDTLLLYPNVENDRTSTAASARLYWVRVNSLARHALVSMLRVQQRKYGCHLLEQLFQD